MEYQRLITLLENTPNQPTKFRIKNWIEINDESQGTTNEDNQIIAMYIYLLKEL